MQRLKTYNTTSNGQQPCECVQKYLQHERSGGTFATWVASFDYNDMNEIIDDIKTFIYAVVGDIYMSDKKRQLTDPFAATIYKRFLKVATDISKFDKYPTAMAAEIWNGGYKRKRIQERFAVSMQQAPDADFADICERIKSIYSLTDLEIEKIHFFVEQVKAGESFPDSFRRMLYIWGEQKMTGKTSVANALVCILNGEQDARNIAEYSTTLTQEMQIRNFAVPKISYASACLMDECFYADMGKTYADFKRFMTASNGRARLPYGQEFAWSGQPNYIATSNDPLRKFIKDWDDRRYLSVNFTQAPTQRLTFEEIYDLWRAFVKNSTRTKEWRVWVDELFAVSEEMGERTEVANEIEIELTQNDFLQIIESKTFGGLYDNNNKITLKFFVDYFATSMGHAEALKRKTEIEKAVERVFGKRYSTTNYWRLSTLKEVVESIRNNNNNNEQESEQQDTTLPF